MEPCEQESNISNILKTLERMDKSQEKVISLLETVANQDARLDHLEESAERNYVDINALYERMREVEMNVAVSSPSRERVIDSLESVTKSMELMGKKLDKLNMFFKYTTHKYALIVYAVVVGMILCGTLLDFLYHKETIAAFLKVFGITL